MEELIQHFYKLLQETNTSFFRYIYKDIDWNNRLIGIEGARGVGKTTLILQHIKKDLNKENSLYITAEDLFFDTNKLVDLANEAVKQGIKYLFIDEIHKYKNWSKELKLIYDYNPELNIVFSGSSILDINKGISDLSRRCVVYKMQGLSFREYLLLFHSIKSKVYSLNEIINNKVEIENLPHPLPLFNDYLLQGYYPFANQGEYKTRLLQIINQTLESDIPFYANMNVSTGRKLKQLLSIISKSTPFKPNFSKIAQMIKVSRNNLADYFLYIEEAGLISQLRDKTGGIRGLGKVDKVYLENTNLIYALSADINNKGNVRETFFFNQMRVNNNIVSSPLSDFQINNLTFEVGGKNKTKRQILNAEKGFVVKDDIEFGFQNTIPLYFFGMNY